MQEKTKKNVHKRAEIEINAVDLIRHLFSHIIVILLISIICMAIAGFYTVYYVTPIYESTAKLYVLNSGDSAINLADLQVGSYLASDYIEVFNTWEVHEMVINNLDLPYSNGQMQGMLTVTNPTNTRILSITVQSPDPHEAMIIANEYANVAILFISKTMATEQPNIMSEAVEAVYPSSPNKMLNVIQGFMIGLFLSMGFITLRFVMDDKIKTADDIRKYASLPVMAVVPTLKQKHGKSTKRERKQ